jgi:hypothetical protein
MALDDWFGLRSYRPCTITIATPGVVTSERHGLVTADKVTLTTTGALPTGLSVDTFYYVIQGTYSDGTTDPDTFKLATSKANAEAGTAIATSSSQSGAHYYSSQNMNRMKPVQHDNR